MSIVQKIKEMVQSWFLPSLDPGLGDPSLSSLMTTLKGITSTTDSIRILSGKTFGDIISRCVSPLREGSWQERAMYVDAISTLPKSEELYQVLTAWCEQDPPSALPFLIRGSFLISWGWEARGYGTADTVTDKGANLMEDRILRAEKDLFLATKLDPHDPTPYIYLLNTLKGLGIEQHDANDYFQKGIALDPENWGIHSAMLALLTEKWFGAHEQTFEFAKQSIASAKPGSLLPALLFKAHIERWLYPVLSLAGIAYKNMSPEEKKQWDDASTYPLQEEVRKETLAAYQEFRQAEGKHSSLALVEPKNYVAFWLYLTQEKEPLKVLLSELGPKQITEYPWVYDGGSAMLTYSKAKTFVGL